MKLNYQNLLDASVEINRCVWASNLTDEDIHKIAKHSPSIHDEKSVQEFIIFHAKEAIKDLTKLINEKI